MQKPDGGNSSATSPSGGRPPPNELGDLDMRIARDGTWFYRGSAINRMPLVKLFASVLRTWVDDDDPGLARTMATLDRALARGQRWSGFLDGLGRIPQCAGRARRRRPEADNEETVAA